MDKEKNDKFKAYLFGSILLVLQVKEFPYFEVLLPILYILALAAAAALGYVVGWRYRRKINPYISTHINDCWRNFDRDIGRAQNDEEAMEAFDNLSKCLRRETDRK